MKVMLAGEVEPRSRTLRPSSREMERINSLKPVERRLSRCPGTISSSALCRTERPNSLLKKPGATANIVWLEHRQHQSFRAWPQRDGCSRRQGSRGAVRSAPSDDEMDLELFGLEKRSLGRVVGQRSGCSHGGGWRLRVQLRGSFRLLDVNRPLKESSIFDGDAR